MVEKSNAVSSFITFALGLAIGPDWPSRCPSGTGSSPTLLHLRNDQHQPPASHWDSNGRQMQIERLERSSSKNKEVIMSTCERWPLPQTAYRKWVSFSLARSRWPRCLVVGRNGRDRCHQQRIRRAVGDDDDARPSWSQLGHRVLLAGAWLVWGD